MKKPTRKLKAADKLFIEAFEDRVKTVRTLTDRIQREQARYNQLTKNLTTLKEDT
jgi:hypothetical protein